MEIVRTILTEVIYFVIALVSNNIGFNTNKG